MTNRIKVVLNLRIIYRMSPLMINNDCY
jgi:hypothetical protein